MKISTGMVNPIQISSTAHGHSSKVTLPVNRSDSFYAHFKYVQGVPASRQQPSVPIKRLELINNMIVSLQNLNRIASDYKERLVSPDKVVAGTQEGDIQRIGKMIHERLQEIPASFAPADSSAVTTGLAFQIQV